ncbi:MAG TPA: hypothetical protein VH912_13540 [Streptosporangiaceae bacterium]
MLLGTRPLTPATSGHNAGNVFGGSATGSAGPRPTFGTDVKTFSGRLDRVRTIRVTTPREVFMLGVVTVTALLRR